MTDSRPHTDAEVLEASGVTLLADTPATDGHLTSHRSIFKPGKEGAPPHLHREASELFFVLKGSLRVLTGDDLITLDARRLPGRTAEHPARLRSSRHHRRRGTLRPHPRQATVRLLPPAGRASTAATPTRPYSPPPATSTTTTTSTAPPGPAASRPLAILQRILIDLSEAPAMIEGMPKEAPRDRVADLTECPRRPGHHQTALPGRLDRRPRRDSRRRQEHPAPAAVHRSGPSDDVRVLDSEHLRDRWKPVLRAVPYAVWRPALHLAYYALVLRAIRTPGPLVIHDCATKPLVRQLIGRAARAARRPVHLIMLDVPADVARLGQRARARVVRAGKHGQPTAAGGRYYETWRPPTQVEWSPEPPQR